MNKNINGLKEHAKARSSFCEKKVLNALDILKKSDSKITIASVARAANVTPNFIYTHEDLLKTVRKYTEPTGRKKIQTTDSKDSLINTLRIENRQLKVRIKELERNDNYKIKYNELEQKYKDLENQLDASYINNLDIMF